MNEYFNTYRELVEKEIKSLSLERDPANLYDPIRYILDLGGKRFRPILTLLSHALFNNDPQKALVPAVAVEVFHNFTLMHDDIMDDAPLRRGKSTVHTEWNISTAILSGDIMLIKAYELLGSVGPDRFDRIFKAFNLCAVEVCEGQQIDMDFEQLNNVTEKQYLEMIRLKTAVLLGFCMELGARIGGANEQQIIHLREFGQSLGIGFQLMDDILDVYGDHDKVGKQIGGDIIENKKTYLWIQAIKLADANQKKTLIEIASEEHFDPTVKVAAVKAIYDNLNIKDRSEEKMNTFFSKAFSLLHALHLDPRRQRGLEDFAWALIKRDK